MSTIYLVLSVLFGSSLAVEPNVIRKLIDKMLSQYNKEAVVDIPIVIHMDVLLLKVKNTVLVYFFF